MGDRKKKNHIWKEIWNMVNIIDEDFNVLYDYVLEKITTITKSQYAFWGYLDEDESILTIYSWSKEVREECRTRDKPVEYPIKNAGIWADSIRKKRAIIINDYENYQYKKGLPEGHVEIKRLLSVPVLIAGKMVAIAVVANKPSNYTREDIRNIEMFMKIAQILIDRKRMENELKKSEVKYRTIVETSNDGIISVDEKGKITFLNKSAERMFCYTEGELLGKSLEVLMPQKYRKKHAKAFVELKKHKRKSTRIIEVEGLRKNGEIFPVEFSISSYKTKNAINFIAVARDLTERKKIEEKLKEEKEKYHTLFEQSPEAIVVVGLDGKILDCNKSALNLSKSSKKDIVGKNFWEIGILNEEDLPDLLEKFYTAIEGKNIGMVEVKTEIKGETKWLEVFPSIVKKENKPYFFQTIVRDVTEKKEAEEKARKSNRMFRMLCECNEALIYAESEKELLKKVCKIIVESGYLLAWIGYAGEEKKVKIAGIYGKPADYVEKIKVTWDKSKFGKGPTGTAIKTGKASIMKDIEHDERYAPWREEAIKHGFKSSIALPLIVNGKTIGALNIYSAEKNAFDKEEVALLSQLANDLAYGIGALRNKVKLDKERKQLLSIFEGIDEPIYVANPNTHKILYANNALKKKFGKNILGKKCYKVLQNLKKPCDFCTNDKIMGENFGKTYVWEVQNRINKRWYRCIDRGIMWHDGRKVRMEIAIDITDKINAEKEMLRALEQEKEFKLRASHYFFNPIAIAKGYLDLAMEELPAEKREKLKSAYNAISRVEKVVKNIVEKGEIYE